MRTIFIIIALFCASILKAQTRFLGNIGGYLVDDAKVIYTNSTINDQLIFADTIRANRLTVDKEYLFNAKFYLTVPALSFPTLTFKVTLAGQPMVFTSNAGLIAGVSNAPLEIRGTIVKRSTGLTYLEFSVLQNGTTGISLTPTTISETSEAALDTSVDMPLALYVAFSTNTNNTTLTKQRLKRSDF